MKSACEMDHRTSPSDGALPRSILTSGLDSADSSSEMPILPDAMPENADAILLT